MHFDDNDIAIVGMAIRVAGAATPEAYWDNLRRGVESVTFYDEQTLVERGVSRSDLADPLYVRAGVELPDVDRFDPEFFGFSAKEAAILDPQHRHFYEVCWEALERAGHPPAAFDGAIGLFAGCGMGAYLHRNVLSNTDLVDSVGLFLLRHTGNDKDFLATRVSYAFDLRGPSINVQTACSTSLVAVHMACQSLLNGESDMVLAGGATIEIPHGEGYHYKEGEILSPDGHCRPFDHRSKGTIFGSGVGVVALRRAQDAAEDGDHIHAIIKATAVNNDGSAKVGYLAPSVEGQSAAVAEALAVAEVDASSIGFVECHGTGTPVGDPIEIAALTRAFRQTTDRVGYCRVGSVKSNIGHLDTAAGVAGLIKTALALEHGQIPATVNFEAPNPAIDFDGSPFTVAAQTSDWESDGGPRRAAVNSLGVGGTNAFAILQEAPDERPVVDSQKPQLIVLSARSRPALDDAGKKLATWLREHPEAALPDVAYSLMMGRHAFEQRRVFACSTALEAADLLETSDPRRVFTHSFEVERPRVVFMYPGGGAQYFRMGRDLYLQEPVFRRHIDAGLALLKERYEADLSRVFFADEGDQHEAEAALAKPSVQLPLIFLVEFAMTRLLEDFGITPDALIGHSMGENTAACISGVLDFEDALGLVLLRGRLMDEVPQGGMLSVAMPAGELQEFLGADLDLAAENSPQLSVASGSDAQLDTLAQRLATAGIDSQRVKIDIAAHSRMLDGILDRFRDFLHGIELGEPKTPILSNRNGDWLTTAQARDPEYWVEHLRNSVLFSKGVGKLLDDGETVFIEAGPGSTLGSLVRQHPEAPAQRVLASMRHPDATADDTTHFRSMLGRFWAVGGTIDMQKLWPQRPRRIPLPTYAFQHSSYWIEPGTRRNADDREALRPLRLVRQEDWWYAPRWIQQGVQEWSGTPKTWWLFHEQEPVALGAIAWLRENGHRVVTIEAGDTFAQIDNTGFTLAPDAGGAGYEELVSELAEAELLPDRILHSWLLTWDQSHRPGSSLFHRNQNYGFYSLFYLARALSRVESTQEWPVHIIVLANGIHRIGEERAEHPEKATVIGPCAVIPREFPAVSCSLVDVDLQQLPDRRRGRAQLEKRSDRIDDLMPLLQLELTAAAENSIIALRAGVRWRRHVVPLEAPPAEAQKLKHGGTYLITGGLGGIGSQLARWLAENYRARLVLLSRTPLPAKEDWSAWLGQHDLNDTISRGILQLRELEQAGAEVLALAADVTVAEQMQDAVSEIHRRFGSLDGVFHAAGVIRDNLIPLKSEIDIEDVFAAKIYGTIVLNEVLKEEPLDFMLLFSSISAFTAPQGQIDYVGANSFLNAYAAAHAKERNYPLLAVNWGIWQGIGMVAGTAAEPRAEHEEDPAADSQPLQCAIFERRFSVRDGVLEILTFEGELSTERHWVVDEHRLADGHALLPGTAYAELIRSAMGQLEEKAPWRITNLVLQRPVFVSDNEPRTLRLRMRGTRGRWDIEFLAAATHAGAEDWEQCAVARVAEEANCESGNVPLQEVAARCTDSIEQVGGSGTLKTSQEMHLRFGPHWQVLKRLAYGDREALAHLKLAIPQATELDAYGLHPGLLDIASGCALGLVSGRAEDVAEDSLWVPISYSGLRYFAPLQRELVSWIRLTHEAADDGGFASFDVSITDSNGNVLVEVSGLTFRRLQGSLRAADFEQLPEPMAAVQGKKSTASARPASPSEAALQHNLALGLSTEEGLTLIDRLLCSALPPTVILTPIAPKALLQQAEAVTEKSQTRQEATFARPELQSDFVPPRNAVERTLAELWSKLLGVQEVGVDDSFFDLGGHSLIAVRLFNEIKERFGEDLPMSVLMQRPTIAALAELFADSDAAAADDAAAAPQARIELEHRFVVPMHTGPVGAATPLFIVAGMFGNVLNLSHLAHLLGEDRAFYALQARGLIGDSEPHERFEEMAADYIEEMRSVQPQGPYLLGGFSGGGIAAYEMARQLIAQGETVAGVVLLDTPLPELLRFGFADRMMMRYQRIQRGGTRFVLGKLTEKIAKYSGARSAEDFAHAPAVSDQPVHFQSARIAAAFERAVEAYEILPAPVHVMLFRPRLRIQYSITGGRQLTPDYQLALHDNGWTPYVPSLEVFEVPGDHDSMVLEPNVRVLVAFLRRAIADALAES